MGQAIAVCLPPSPPVDDDEDDFVPNPTNPKAEFELSGGVSGTFTVEVFLDRTPLTASNFIALAQTGFYDGLHFHRVIPNFMNQFGCPLSRDPNNNLAGTGGPEEGSTFTNLATGATETRGKDGCIRDELVSEDSNDKATLSMANAGPNTGGSQFFLNVADNDALDWFGDGSDQHVVFGRIVEGMEVVVAVSQAKVVDESISDDADRRPLSPIRVDAVTITNLPKPKPPADPWA